MNSHTPDGEPATAEWVIARLEEAGLTLLALPNTGPSTRLVQSGMEWAQNIAQAFEASRAKIRPAVPSAAHITRMDQAYRWISRLPDDKYVLRRVVGARSLVSPMTGRHLYSWRRLGTAIGADHKAVQRWHAQGIDLIVACLNRAEPVARSSPALARPARMRAASASLGYRVPA
ncbi:MAG: DUF6362 family protein [Acetobacteraceae bacterium]|nr:DUF6362 family protein [Acetobacteraceae bacterium]